MADNAPSHDKEPARHRTGDQDRGPRKFAEQRSTWLAEVARTNVRLAADSRVEEVGGSHTAGEPRKVGRQAVEALKAWEDRAHREIAAARWGRVRADNILRQRR